MKNKVPLISSTLVAISSNSNINGKVNNILIFYKKKLFWVDLLNFDDLSFI